MHTWELPCRDACHQTGRDPFCSTPPSLSLEAQPFYRTVQLYLLNLLNCDLQFPLNVTHKYVPGCCTGVYVHKSTPVSDWPQ